jgi:hypothetical protein
LLEYKKIKANSVNIDPNIVYKYNKYDAYIFLSRDPHIPTIKNKGKTTHSKKQNKIKTSIVKKTLNKHKINNIKQK